MFRILLVAWLLDWLPASAATAILNAISEGGGTRMLVIEFRAVSAEGWKVSQAALFLHHGSGEPPSRVRVAAVDGSGKPRRMRAYPATRQPQGWVKVAIDAALVEALAARTATGLAIEQRSPRFDGLAPVFTQPYLMVEGSRK